MGKLYRETIEQLLLILVEYRQLNGNTKIIDFWKRVKPDLMEGGRVRTVLQHARQQSDAGFDSEKDLSVDDLITQLSDLLYTMGGEDKSGDVIDAIVKILQFEYAKSTFGSKYLKRLRNALLMPTEQAAAALAEEKAALCAICGHEFDVYEMATAMFANNGAKTGFYCMNCVKPATMACGNCEGGVVEISKTILRALTKMVRRCAKCQPKEELKEVAKSVQDVRDLVYTAAPDPVPITLDQAVQGLQPIVDENTTIALHPAAITQRVVRDLDGMYRLGNIPVPAPALRMPPAPEPVVIEGGRRNGRTTAMRRPERYTTPWRRLAERVQLTPTQANNQPGNNIPYEVYRRALEEETVNLQRQMQQEMADVNALLPAAPANQVHIDEIALPPIANLEEGGGN